MHQEIQKWLNHQQKKLIGNDEEIYYSSGSCGGIGDLLGQANANMDNPGPLSACLDGLGTLCIS